MKECKDEHVSRNVRGSRLTMCAGTLHISVIKMPSKDFHGLFGHSSCRTKAVSGKDHYHQTAKWSSQNRFHRRPETPTRAQRHRQADLG